MHAGGTLVEHSKWRIVRAFKSHRRYSQKLPFLSALSLGLALVPPGGPSALLAQQPAASGAKVFSGAEIDRKLAGLATESAATGGGSAVLENYGSHAIVLSLRSTTGNAEIHAHFNDVILVRRGKATLCTGGTVIDGKTTADGETKGTGIRGCTRQTITAGDVIHIPAGTPHQILLAPKTTFVALVVKVRE